MAQSSLKILVVDDDPDVLAMAALQLGQIGYTVLQATDGVEALRLLHAHPDIGLLFTDIVMPGHVDGFDLADRARRLRPGLKVLYTSAYLKDDSVWYGNLLPKPWGPRELNDAIRAALA
ncbi:MAG TPA: response regulator [Alphaproteobacteria bacterium]